MQSHFQQLAVTLSGGVQQRKLEQPDVEKVDEAEEADVTSLQRKMSSQSTVESRVASAVVSTIAESDNFLANGQRKMMRIFVTYEGERSCMDIPEGKRIKTVKKLVQDKFHIQDNEIQLGDENREKNTLVLSYSGAQLQDDWVVSDIGLTPGSTIRAYIKEELDPVFYLKVAYNHETIAILDRIKIYQMSVASLRSLASHETGLPIGVFRLTNKNGVEMFDCHSLDIYSIKPGDVINVLTWDGWNEFLHLAALGFTSHVISRINQIPNDEVLSRFHMKVAMYVAAHFGHVELAMTLTKLGVRCDEPVGEHPLKQWNSNHRHVDLRKAPIHEAVEAGQLSVLRSFVHQNVCSIMTRDGQGLQPLNIALRMKRKPCASFLLTKQWSRITYAANSLPLAIYARMKNWADRSREKVVLTQGLERSTSKRRPVREFPLVGQGVYVDGFSSQQINSRPKAPSMAKQSGKWAIDEYYRSIFTENAEEYFKHIVNHYRLPKVPNKWNRMTGVPSVEPQSRTSRAAVALHEDLNINIDQLASNTEAGTTKTSADVNSLPQIHKRKNYSHQHYDSKDKMNVIIDDSPSRPSSSRSVYPEPNKENDTTGEGEKRQKRKTGSASLLAQAKASDATMPLPLNSIADTPRPFFYVKPKEKDIVKETLQSFKQHRGIKGRDSAIRCLSMANTFKEKPWLFQVRLAMTLSEQGVKKCVSKLKNKSLLASET